MVLPASAGDVAVDCKRRRQIVDRFRAHHRQRLQHLRVGLEPEQRVLLDALPLLVHVNHPALPGFIDHGIPSGIDRYTPDAAAIAAARALALSYAPERLIERSRNVQAVLWEPDESPQGAHRLWVCAAETHHAALARKLEAIAEHARRIGLTVSVGSIDPLAVRARATKLGSTSVLALDRFYTDALWIAGRYPLWWVVPTSEQRGYTDYASRLREQRFVAADETFDLGPVAAVPAHEWLGASLELLERAQLDPFSMLPRLQLIEARTARAEEGLGLLAHAYKEAVHREPAAPPGPELDPTSLVRREVERYLAQVGDEGRLVYSDGKHGSAGFKPDPGWSLARRIEEQRRLVVELERALTVAASLTAADARTGAGAPPRLERIRGLLVAPSAMPDTIPVLHESLLGDQGTSPIEVGRTDAGWYVAEAGSTLFASPRLAAIGAWLHWCRIAPERVHLEDGHARARVLDLVHRLRSTSRPRSFVVVVNAEHEPLHERLMDADALVGEWNDPLDYSGYHHNLVASADRIDVGRAITCIGDDGAPGLTSALEQALRREPDKVEILCVGAVRSRGVEERLGELLAELRATFHGDSAAGRFVFANGAGFTLVTRDVGGLTFASPQDEAVLHALLRAPLPARRPITHADSRSRRLGWLRQLAEVVEVGRVTFLLVDDAKTASPEITVYLSDHDGGIHRFVVPGRTMNELANELDVFFTRQRLTGAAAPRMYSSTPRGLVELRVAPPRHIPHLALRVRREPGRVDIYHGERRWSNVLVSATVLDELIASAGAGSDGTSAVPAVGEVAFDADSPRLAELLALKLGFERRLRERTRAS